MHQEMCDATEIPDSHNHFEGKTGWKGRRKTSVGALQKQQTSPLVASCYCQQLQRSFHFSKNTHIILHELFHMFLQSHNTTTTALAKGLKALPICKKIKQES